MIGKTSSVKGVLAYFSTPIIPNIDRYLTREGLIDIHQFIRGNVASMVSNLGGGRHGQLVLTLTDVEYKEEKVCAFVMPHNPGNYPQSMGSAQEQALES